MKVVLVYNIHSGSAPSKSTFLATFARHGITLIAKISVKEGFEARLKRHIKNGQIIAVLGGDGTQSNVAHLLVGTGAIMAPLAGGTLNHFTKDVGITQDLDEALARLVKAHVRSVDVARVNGKVFLNNSSLGLYPSSLAVRQHFEDKLGKWPAAVIGSVRALWSYRTYALTINGEDLTTPFVFVGNNTYHLDGPTASGRTRLDEAVLSVYAIESRSRWHLVKVLGLALIGRGASTPEFKQWQTTKLTIKSRRAQLNVSRDGELNRLNTPLVYTIEPGVLKILG